MSNLLQTFPSAEAGAAAPTPERATSSTVKASVYKPPADLPPGMIAYNPSGFQAVKFETASGPREVDVLYVRVETDRNDGQESHLGKTISRAYYTDEADQLKPVWTLFHQEGMSPEDDAELQRRYDVPGEDPSFKRIPVRQADGTMRDQWMLSTVMVEAEQVEYTDDNGDLQKRTIVTNLYTKIRIADSLEAFNSAEQRDNCIEINGPSGMKDLRITPIHTRDTDGTGVVKYMVYGRPQGELKDIDGNSYFELGNITSAIVDSPQDIERPEVQHELMTNFLKSDLFPGERWGGTNDAMQLNETTVLMLAHDAKKTGEDGRGRYYTPILILHDFSDPSNPIITELGPIAPPESFPSDTTKYAAKADEFVDLNSVVFPGGFSLELDDRGELCIRMTAGYRDSQTAEAVVRLNEEPFTIIQKLYKPELALAA